jgi:hypothetical protein
MAFLDFITRNEPIAGLEINDDFLRIVQLKKERVADFTELPGKEKGKKLVSLKKKYIYKTKVIAVAEVELEEGVVSAGKILNPEKLKTALVKLLKKNKNISRYVVVSLPADRIYSHYFSFPNTIGPDKIAETMRLTMEFQLPVVPSENYTDWQLAESNSVVLAAAKKDLIEALNGILVKSGFNTIAVEFAPLSVARTFSKDITSRILCLVQFDRSSMTIAVVENGAPKFVRTLPESQVPKSAWVEEVRKVIEYYEAEYHKKIELLYQVGLAPALPKKSVLSIQISEIIGTSNISDKLIDSNDGRWLAALGAAERGVLKRSEDKLLSLMSIRTEEAYETKKALAFMSFSSGLIISLSAFMVAIYAGLWLMTVSLQRSVSNQVKALSAIPVPQGGAELEARAATLNELISKNIEVIRSLPRWSLVIEELKNKVPAGINIQSVNFPNISGVISVSGTASDRNQLRMFKKLLDESGTFVGVEMPISNISIRENIPFSLTMRLSDPASFYYH